VGYRIAIVEDHLLQRKYAVSLIARQQDMTVAFSGESLPEFISWLRAHPESRLPDLLLLDLMVDRQRSARPETVKQLVDQGCRVILFSALGSPVLVRKMVHAGVHGVLGKRDEDRNILAALRTVLDGGQWMSPELAQVLSHDQQRPKLSDQEERVLLRTHPRRGRGGHRSQAGHREEVSPAGEGEIHGVGPSTPVAHRSHQGRRAGWIHVAFLDEPPREDH